MPIISFKDYVNLQHSTNEDTNQSVSCRMERSRETEPINFLVNDPKFFCGSGPNLFLQNSSIHNVHHELDVFGCERNDEMPLPMLSVSVSLCVLVHGYLSFCFNDVLEGMHLLASWLETGSWRHPSATQETLFVSFSNPCLTLRVLFYLSLFCV